MIILPQESQGSFYALLSGFLYGLLGYFGMMLVSANFSIFNILFWRFLVSTALILTIFFFQRKSSENNLQQAWQVFLYGGAFYTGSAVIYFYASLHLGTGLAMVIFFTYPAIVMLLNWILYKARPTKFYFIAVAIMMAGLILLADFSDLSFNAKGISLGLLAAASYAAYLVFSKRIIATPIISTLMVCLGCSMSCLILTLLDHSFTIPQNVAHWFYIMSFGILCTALPILLMLEALKKISTLKASLLSVSEPVFVMIFGILLLGERLTGKQTFGILTLLSGALITLICSSNTTGSREMKEGLCQSSCEPH